MTAPKGYNAVGATWLFSGQPPLDRSELVLAITSAIKEQERREEEARKKAEEARKGKEKPQSDTGPKSGEKNETSQTSAGPPRETPAADAGSTGPSKPAAGSGDNRVFLLIIGSIVTVIAVVVVWAFVRSKVSSHAIMHRYALYLSTLSYQQIRALNGGQLAKANVDLAGYLRFIRDDPGGDKTSYFGQVRELPVIIDPKDNLAILAASGQPIIC